MRYFAFILLLSVPVLGYTQTHHWKLAPPLRANLQQRSTVAEYWTIHTTDLVAFQKLLAEKQWSDRVIQMYEPANVLVLKLTPNELQTEILPVEVVTFIDRALRPLREELALNNFDISANRVNLVHRKRPGLNGIGQVASVKENRFDSDDLDLVGRTTRSEADANFQATHATIMATIIGGGGNSFYTGKGVAWGAQLTSADFRNLLPEPNAHYRNFRIGIQNHSYGVGVESYYGNDAAAYDASVAENPTLLHVFSAGNSGTEADTLGRYRNINGYANLTGSFKMAKNTLAVGATDSLGAVAALSSRGPAHDGRLKPELVAFGLDGSSGAAAMVSGIGLLLQQSYQQRFGTLPPAALAKAVLINSAEDTGSPGIDFISGYGKVNAWRALQTLGEERFFKGTLANSEMATFPIAIPENARNLKVTLAWTDPPALPGSDMALVNDLDLQLKSGGQTWLPWVLHTAPDADSLALLPVRKADRLNNAEQITIAEPEAGEYEIQVRGFQLATARQDFYIAYQYDTLGYFQWTFPTADDPLVAGQTAVVRWESVGLSEVAALELSTDQGNTWETLTIGVNLENGYAHWQVPDTFAFGLLRLRTEAAVFTTERFSISSPLQMKVGFNCPDSILLFWEPEPRAESYQVFGLEDAYLAPLATTADTFILLQKQHFPALHYAVAPLLTEQWNGLRSRTIDYSRQGVACYISSFLAERRDDAIRLRLALGSLYEVANITFEKWDGTAFRAIGSINAPNRLQSQFDDTDPKAGINTYRAMIALTNGSRIASESVDVYYAGEAGYLLFPNPVSAAEDVILLTRQPAGQTLLLFDALGRTVLTYPIGSDFEVIPLGTIASGLYFYTIETDGKRVAGGKLLIRP